MIPLPEPGKDSSTTSSYIPIYIPKLQAVSKKTIERIINVRLQLKPWKRKPPCTTAGMRQAMLLYLSQEIEDASRDAKLVLAAFFQMHLTRPGKHQPRSTACRYKISIPSTSVQKIARATNPTVCSATSARSLCSGYRLTTEYQETREKIEWLRKALQTSSFVPSEEKDDQIN